MIHLHNNDQPAGNLRILLADDNVVEQKIAARMFQDLGYDADVVSNGFEIVQAVRLRPYDVIFIDETMPGMNAQETAARIRQLPALWKQPWIVMMQSSEGPINEKKPINDVIAKPLNEDMLRQVLAEVPEIWQQRSKQGSKTH